MGLVLIAASCGSSSATTDALVLLIDSPPTDSPAPGPSLVTVLVFDGKTSFVTYRDGAGPWLVPTLDAMGFYELHVTNDFQLVIVCADSTGFDSSLFDATAAEVGGFYVHCLKNLPAPPATVAASGQMTQPGTLYMHDTATSATGPWNFSLNVPIGVHDLVAYDSSDMLIRRNQTISGATSISTVDLSQGGSAMTPVTLTINNRQSGDTLKADLDLALSNGFATLTGSSATILTPPSSLLLPSDLEFLFLSIRTPTTFRYADAQFSTSQTTFDLMPVLAGISYSQSGGVLAGAWGTLPSNREIEMSLYTSSSSSTSSFQRVSATQGWLAAKSASQIGFDVSPPGYDSSWSINLAGPYVREFSAFGGSGAVSYGTSLLEGVNGGIPRVSESASADVSAGPNDILAARRARHRVEQPRD